MKEKIVYSGKVIYLLNGCIKKAHGETLCKIWFAPFLPWLPSSMSNHDGKWVFYECSHNLKKTCLSWWKFSAKMPFLEQSMMEGNILYYLFHSFKYISYRTRKNTTLKAYNFMQYTYFFYKQPVYKQLTLG